MTFAVMTCTVIDNQSFAFMFQACSGTGSGHIGWSLIGPVEHDALTL